MVLSYRKYGYVSTVLNGLFSISLMATKTSKHKIFLTRRLPAPAWELLSANSSNLELIVRDSEEPVPYKELLEGIVGMTALYCSSPDRVDRNVIERAGPNLKVNLLVKII